MKKKRHERHEDELDGRHESQDAERLAAPDGCSGNGGDEKPRKRGLLSLALPASPERQNRGEDDGQPKGAGGNPRRRLLARSERKGLENGDEGREKARRSEDLPR